MTIYYRETKPRSLMMVQLSHCSFHGAGAMRLSVTSDIPDTTSNETNLKSGGDHTNVTTIIKGWDRCSVMQPLMVGAA